MSISTHEELLQAVIRWGGKAEFRERAGDAIPLAEAKINRKLRTMEMETSNGTFTISGEYVALPTNFAGVRTFYLNGLPRLDLEHRPNDQQAIDYPTDTGKPRFYNITDNQFRFAPVPNANYTATLIYFLKVPALTSSATTNWLLTSHPDAYFYGALSELYEYAGDMQKADRFAQRMYAVLEEIKTQSNRDRLGTGLTMRLA
jgi:hypothetical protein